MTSSGQLSASPSSFLSAHPSTKGKQQGSQPPETTSPKALGLHGGQVVEQDGFWGWLQLQLMRFVPTALLAAPRPEDLCGHGFGHPLGAPPAQGHQ